MRNISWTWYSRIPPFSTQHYKQQKKKSFRTKSIKKIKNCCIRWVSQFPAQRTERNKIFNYFFCSLGVRKLKINKYLSTLDTHRQVKLFFFLFVQKKDIKKNWKKLGKKLWTLFNLFYNPRKNINFFFPSF